ncbi:hypothetical protein AMTR_s00051p00109970 [Amborella trichopoda]|uniref:Uncharacterized protein n=1 Tax=Amborella trichopoda TaxID=13333 RepID=U5D2J6_AMBTC|nr:hypothetical protein AMTR_s00051p00109970 [Amborella trichopoda]
MQHGDGIDHVILESSHRDERHIPYTQLIRKHKRQKEFIQTATKRSLSHFYTIIKKSHIPPFYIHLDPIFIYLRQGNEVTPHVGGIEDIIKGKSTPTKKRKLHGRLAKNVDPRGVSHIELPTINLLLYKVHHVLLARGDMPCCTQTNPPTIGWDDGGSSSTQSFLPSHSSPHLLNYLRSHILLHHHHHQEKGRQHGDDGEETISASSQQTKGFAIASSDPCRCPRCLPLFSCLRDDASSAPATGGGEEVAEERKDKISPEEPQVMQTPQQVSSSPSHDATQSFAYSGRRLGTWIEGHDDIFTKRRKVNHEKTLNTDQYGYGISGYYNRILQTPSNVREPSDTLRTRPPKDWPLCETINIGAHRRQLKHKNI